MADIRTLDRFARAVEKLANPKRDGYRYKVSAKESGRLTVTRFPVVVVTLHDGKVVMDVPIGAIQHRADQLYAHLKLRGVGPIWGKVKQRRRLPAPTKALMKQQSRLRIKPDKPSSRNGLRNRTIRKLPAIQAAGGV